MAERRETTTTRISSKARLAGVLVSVGLAVSLTAAASPVSARDTRQAEIDRIMAMQPGGVQVSDNAVVWGDADVVLVVPDAGSKVAPDGLGSNVRTKLLSTPSMRALDVTTHGTAVATMAKQALGVRSTHGCPGGVFTKDYYCFYQYKDWEGRRVQFTGATEAADAEKWGFDNGTTSWVSNDVDCTVRAYNPKRPKDMSKFMWRQPENSVSRYVGKGNDNKMSFWTCR